MLSKMDRREFAERITASISGWFQQLASQQLESQVGEDAARVELVRTVSALRQYVPETSKRPTNWPATTKKRIDVAVLGRSNTAQGWYGAMELKWPTLSVDVKATRQKVVEDIVRVAFAQTANLCANFLVLGGTREALEKLFDSPHSQSANSENQRKAFSSLLSRDMTNPNGTLTNHDLNQHFPDFGDRVPQTVFNGWTRRLKTELVSRSDANIGSREIGHVFVWQCKK